MIAILGRNMCLYFLAAYVCIIDIVVFDDYLISYSAEFYLIFRFYKKLVVLVNAKMLGDSEISDEI
jgi:hypothetical protein